MPNTYIPPAAQSTYDMFLSDGLPGTIADNNPRFTYGVTAFGSPLSAGLVASMAKVANGLPYPAKIGGGNVAATSGSLMGTGLVNQVIANWTPVTAGSFQVAIDGVTVSVTGLNFSTVTDMASVATAIQTALRTAAGTAGVTNATSIAVTFADGSFTITSGTTGANSSVDYIGNATSGTSIIALMGMGTYLKTDGIDALTGRVLGIVIREYNYAANTIAATVNSYVIPEGQTAAVLAEGAIKVLCKEATATGGTVYYDKTDGTLWASAGANREALGTSTWMGSFAQGSVGIVQVKGVR